MNKRLDFFQIIIYSRINFGKAQKMEGLSFFNLASKRMGWLADSQRIVAENVANADTPGFKARTTTGFDKMLNDSVGASLSTSHPDHIAPVYEPSADVEEDTQTWGESPNGNTVVLEQQSIKANDINENYQLASSLYRKGHDLVRLAATGIR